MGCGKWPNAIIFRKVPGAIPKYEEACRSLIPRGMGFCLTVVVMAESVPLGLSTIGSS
jgi:hypothetical protein